MTIMTEEEARTKWCPMARNAIAEDYGSQNRETTGDMDRACCCLASDCACWMWYRSPEVCAKMNDGSQPTGGCGLGGVKQ